VSDLVLPSKLSGMLASGRPIIAMAEPGTGIATETSETGLVIPPEDADALGGALIALSQDKALRTRLGAAARLRAAQKWDRISIIRGLEREFLALTQRPAAAARPRLNVLSRSIEQITTGTRRRPEFGDRTPTTPARRSGSSVTSKKH
jgi:colanic acid biosynthesis glycosyl transferase WcaI